MKKALLYIALIIILPIALFYSFGGGFGAKEIVHVYDKDGPLIFAHRGITNTHIENTEPAINECIEKGFYALETDIYNTADNHTVVFHDRDGSRLLGINKGTKELTLKEIQDSTLRLNTITSDQHVITSETLLEKYSDKLIIYLDAKAENKVVADSMIAQIQRHNAYDNTIVAYGNALWMMYTEFKDPRINTVLEGFNTDSKWTYYLLPKKFKPDYYSSFIHKIDSSHIEFMKEVGIFSNYIAYGVKESNIQQAIDYGLNNYILDYHPEHTKQINKYLKPNVKD